jgi:hypothetical protein
MEVKKYKVGYVDTETNIYNSFTVEAATWRRLVREITDQLPENSQILNINVKGDLKE